MQRSAFRWPEILLGASLVPTLLLSAFILWFEFALRRPGLEAWGDGTAILYLGVATLPLSLLLLVAGTFWIVRVQKRIQQPVPWLARAMFAASVVGLAVPWFLAVMLLAD